jgi:hypothetical protein
VLRAIPGVLVDEKMLGDAQEHLSHHQTKQQGTKRVALLHSLTTGANDCSIKKTNLMDCHSTKPPTGPASENAQKLQQKIYLGSPN